MLNYKPVPFTSRQSQSAPPARATKSLGAPAPTPPPPIDPVYSSFDGVPGFIETVIVLAITGSAAWVGICTGTKKQNTTLVRSAGWIGGVGSGLIGLLYLGGKSGLNDYVGLPAVRVSPS